MVDFEFFPVAVEVSVPVVVAVSVPVSGFAVLRFTDVGSLLESVAVAVVEVSVESARRTTMASNSGNQPGHAAVRGAREERQAASWTRVPAGRMMGEDE